MTRTTASFQKGVWNDASRAVLIFSYRVFVGLFWNNFVGLFWNSCVGLFWNENSATCLFWKYASRAVLILALMTRTTASLQKALLVPFEETAKEVLLFAKQLYLHHLKRGKSTANFISKEPYKKRLRWLFWEETAREVLWFSRQLYLHHFRRGKSRCFHFKRALHNHFKRALQNYLKRALQTPAPGRLSYRLCMYSQLRGGGLGSRPKKIYGESLGDGVEYHLMKPTPRR